MWFKVAFFLAAGYMWSCSIAFVSNCKFYKLIIRHFFPVLEACFTCSVAKWHPYRICCLVYITTQTWVRLLLWVLCARMCVWVQTCTSFQCVCACVPVKPSLKAFKRERERVWNPGMTSLSMMSFLQGDFGTWDRFRWGHTFTSNSLWLTAKQQVSATDRGMSNLGAN